MRLSGDYFMDGSKWPTITVCPDDDCAQKDHFETGLRLACHQLPVLWAEPSHPFLAEYLWSCLWDNNSGMPSPRGRRHHITDKSSLIHGIVA